ncbi:ferritin-like domain-containing protein [Caminibacter mediatlanticus TB-2]|uniref:Ferritin-like domain-containing protein n=1 Tax=Caminibacter mediatlanticus TB-2 TaxID=391592 RepID=A0ABX5V885_9BACT|nr:ferritin-like domain-containing protein [Caminibacter mediatlanticus]QCT94490.1 ferritin-like domain-containing protein [Caminibacter mediatlanticus TB-2]
MFYKTLEEIITCDNIPQKFSMFNDLYKNINNFNFHSNKKPKIFKKPSYESFCKIVSPSQVPRRRGFESNEKKAILLHAIVHIEYSAIDLALDACYRFRNLDKEFYLDWLEVADDEIRHFKLINSLLEKTGYKYGDFPVHNSLFEASTKTQDLLSRMAIIPRWYEANGLDANEKIINKLSRYNDSFAKEVIEALKIILKEEIPHVKKGDKWFKRECKRLNLEPIQTYFEIVDNFFKDWKKKDLNVSARLKAGFSCQELKILNEKIEC